MCGVAGILDWTSPAATLREQVQRMGAQLVHRGPDDGGEWAAPGIGLAHRRLAIIDPAGGHQPMRADGLVVSFNGEIFNFIELREEFAQRGWRFTTRSDTEVLLAGWRLHGPAFLQRLNGQFALALWDERRRELLLARDHAGIHPLYVTREDGRLLFASEVKALQAAMNHALQPDFAALDQIFTFWVPLPPATGFAGIEQLRPGEYWLVSSAGIERRRWFEWRHPPRGEELRLDEHDAVAQLRALLENAVRLRLRADVPVGCYLSGGLDSSATTALAARLGPAPHTWSVSFAGTDVDEAVWQTTLHRHLGVQHHSVTVTPERIAAELPRAVWHAERPLLRTAPVPMMYLSADVAAHGNRVVLTGEGADEVLAGYDLFKEAKVRRFWARRPQSSWRWRLLLRLYPWMQLGSADYLRHFFGRDLDAVAQPWFGHLPRWHNTAQCRRFYDDAMAARQDDDPVRTLAAWLPPDVARWAPLHREQYLEATLLMEGYLLSSQGDRMLMANGVEGRFPFLDPELVRFANGLAPALKLPALREKNLLRKAVSDLLPARILARPKQPYRAPDAQVWTTATWLDDVLSPARVQRAGYFRRDRVELLRRKARAGRLLAPRDQMAMTGIVTTQLWHEQFIEGNVDAWIADRQGRVGDGRRSPQGQAVHSSELPVHR